MKLIEAVWLVIGLLVFGAALSGCTNSDARQGDDWRLDGTAAEETGGDATGTDARCEADNSYEPPDEPQVYRRVFDNSRDTYICPEELEPGVSGEFTCVRKGTETRVRCRYVDGDIDGMEVECRAVDQCRHRWRPVCDDFNKFNDRESGKRCWEPPEHYCAGGCGDAVTWFCKPDGSVCCISCTCSNCGWIQVSSETSCKVSGESMSESESFCREFWATIEEPFKSCIQGECSEAEREKARSHPACEEVGPLQSVRICR